MKHIRRFSTAYLPEEDKMGFAVPVSPSHSLKLLNNYMRTDLLRSVHGHIQRMKEQKEKGSPIHHLAKSLDLVIGSFEGVNFFETVSRNPFHIDPNYMFQAEHDYLHDIKLMKHHLKCHNKTIDELRRHW